MHDFFQVNLSLKDLQTLNNCQMYLQVTTLAEIATHNGTQILSMPFNKDKPHPPCKPLAYHFFDGPINPTPAKKHGYFGPVQLRPSM